jgi:uncharacterized protein YpmS
MKSSKWSAFLLILLGFAIGVLVFFFVLEVQINKTLGELNKNDWMKGHWECEEEITTDKKIGCDMFCGVVYNHTEFNPPKPQYSVYACNDCLLIDCYRMFTDYNGQWVNNFLYNCTFGWHYETICSGRRIWVENE